MTVPAPAAAVPTIGPRIRGHEATPDALLLAAQCLLHCRPEGQALSGGRNQLLDPYSETRAAT